MKRRIIALDCDGVLLDYHLAYATAWERAFGVFPAEQDPLAYWPWDRWKVQRLNGEPLSRFRNQFNELFWQSIPALPGALEACKELVKARYTLTCVSAMHPQYHGARLKNLREHGFPIQELLATPVTRQDINPKLVAIRRLHPDAFVDDYVPYMRQIPPHIHCALIDRGLHGGPNSGVDMERVNSKHAGFADFASWWLNQHAATSDQSQDQNQDRDQ